MNNIAGKYLEKLEASLGFKEILQVVEGHLVLDDGDNLPNSLGSGGLQ